MRESIDIAAKFSEIIPRKIIALLIKEIAEIPHDILTELFETIYGSVCSSILCVMSDYYSFMRTDTKTAEERKPIAIEFINRIADITVLSMNITDEEFQAIKESNDKKIGSLH